MLPRLHAGMARAYFYVFKEKWPDFAIEIANLVRKTVLVAQLQRVVYDVQNRSLLFLQMKVAPLPLVRILRSPHGFSNVVVHV